MKQIDLSDDDLQKIKFMHRRKIIALWGKAHIRIRDIITKAYPQLKKYVGHHNPAIIVIFDNTKGFINLHYEDILNAMYGDEKVEIGFPEGIDNDARIMGHKFGGHRKVTPNKNRSLSAVALLRVENNMPSLDIFHNIHARIPLKPELGWQFAKNQFTLPMNTDDYKLWVPLIK